VCCHTGKPDWGNGPKGEGRIFKISRTDQSAPLPVLTWAQSEKETVFAFDRPLEESVTQNLDPSKFRMETGRYVSAADRLETIRPGYAVVAMQQRQPRIEWPVKSARVAPDRRSIVVETDPRTAFVNGALAMSGLVGSKAIDVAFDLSGVSAEWLGKSGKSTRLWLPHPDFIAAREFTRGSTMHDALWKDVEQPGKLTVRGQLDLWQMLIPATQPTSKLDYTPEPETVTVGFKSDAGVTLEATGAKVDRVSANESRLTVVGAKENGWPAFTLNVATPAKSLDVSFFTDRDPRPRALPLRRFLMPFAKPAPPDDLRREIPEIAGGNKEAGRALFNGKATCYLCHKLNGEGNRVGPELSNLVHRDYASVLKDIVDPNAMINPDAVGYIVTMKDGSGVVGTRLAETDDELQIAQPGGAVAKLKRPEIVKIEPMTVSLMPVGLDKALTREELRDLMTYLLTESPK
ncbi:MAG TPA: c-type cytochrome, partial [Chthoniobacteraceae bacterium]